jgi:hypothetical protein
MLAMRTSLGVRRARGPFLLPARTLLLTSGLLAVALAAFLLFHELHSGQANGIYTIVALVVGAVWLICIVLAFSGQRLGIFGAAAIAFVEFAMVASTHFVSAAGALGTFVKHEGLPVATVAMTLVPACAVVVITAAVSWTNPRGRNPRLETLPLLVAAFLGAALVILQATDSVHRADFGRANVEDGAFAAAVSASLWLLGGLWIARVRRTGAILIALATFIVSYSFVTLHLVRGGTTMSEIASTSGPVWAVISVAVAVLAAASLLLAVGLLAVSIIRRKPAALPGGTQPAQREA